MRAKTGQVAIYLVMTLVVLCLLTLLNVDTFVAVRAKNRLQNGGDAAALAAARKQGALLNEIGRLNLEHFAAAIRNDAAACEEIVAAQRRLALLGPVEALRLADEAARRNGMEERGEFAAILREHVAEIRTVYAGGGGEGDPYPEPYPGAWTEYATAIDDVIAGGLATGPDNVEFFDAAGGHLLLERQFYHAIAAKNWCWFHFHAEHALKTYDSYHDWGPLPARRENSLDNSEIFSLHVTAKTGALSEVFTPDELRELAERFLDLRLDPEAVKTNLLSNARDTWFFFDEAAWHPWFDGLRLADDDEGYEFPLAGEIRPEYNIRGCAAICRCVKGIDSVALETSSDHTWSAAAKPFGTLENLDGETDTPLALKGLVTPAMNAVRLVPLDAVGGENLATADYGWVEHVRRHLFGYLERGPTFAASCYYCQQLAVWERASFRNEGVRWLKFHAGTCIRPTGGVSGHGGTSHGH